MLSLYLSLCVFIAGRNRKIRKLESSFIDLSIIVKQVAILISKRCYPISKGGL